MAVQFKKHMVKIYVATRELLIVLLVASLMVSPFALWAVEKFILFDK
jgi:hypothetical protein